MAVAAVPGLTLIAHLLASIGGTTLVVPVAALNTIVAGFIPVMAVGVSFGDGAFSVDESVSVVA